MRRTPFHQELPIWILTPVRDMMGHMSFETWREGGCEVLADLYPGETFITYEQACGDFELGQGHYLHYAGLMEIAKVTWPTYPDIPQTTLTLDILLTCSSGRRLISLLFKAMRMDSTSPPPRARVTWDADPLGDKTWSAISALTHTVSCNEHFKRVHYNFIHRTYMTPVKLHRITLALSDACPRCDEAGADFLHLAWDETVLVPCGGDCAKGHWLSRCGGVTTLFIGTHQETLETQNSFQAVAVTFGAGKA